MVVKLGSMPVAEKTAAKTLLETWLRSRTGVSGLIEGLRILEHPRTVGIYHMLCSSSVPRDHAIASFTVVFGGGRSPKGAVTPETATMLLTLIGGIRALSSGQSNKEATTRAIAALRFASAVLFEGASITDATARHLDPPDPDWCTSVQEIVLRTDPAIKQYQLELPRLESHAHGL